jgi:hypothetical protein
MANRLVAATVCVQAVTSTKAQNFAIVLSVLDVSDDCAAVRDCTQGTAGQGSSQAPAPAPWLLLMSRSNPDAAAMSQRCARRGRHPSRGAAVVIAGGHE